MRAVGRGRRQFCGHRRADADCSAGSALAPNETHENGQRPHRSVAGNPETARFVSESRVEGLIRPACQVDGRGSPQDVLVLPASPPAGVLPVAAENAARRKPEARFEAVLRAYRAWALAQPHRYPLLFGPPSFESHAQRLVAAAQKATKIVADVLSGLPDHPVTGMNRALSSQLSAWSRSQALGINANVAYRDIITWIRVHGFVSLELAGAFGSAGIDSDHLFDAELANLMTSLLG